jgi:oleandomycin transport system ATP-binding protein
VDAEQGLVRVPVPDPAVLPGIIRDLDEAGVELAEFALRKPSLDEVFLALTGGQAPDDVPAGHGELPELDRSPR